MTLRDSAGTRRPRQVRLRNLHEARWLALVNRDFHFRLPSTNQYIPATMLPFPLRQPHFLPWKAAFTPRSVHFPPATITTQNRSSTLRHRGCSPCRRHGRAPLRLTAWWPSRARRSSAFCFVGSPSQIVPAVSSLRSPRSGRPPQQSTSTHRFALGSGSACSGVPRPRTGQKEKQNVPQ